MNKRLRDEIMDLRDHRIRMQRKLIALEDKEFFEPKAFTEEDAYLVRYYRAEIAQVKATEDELRHRMYEQEK